MYFKLQIQFIILLALCLSFQLKAEESNQQQKYINVSEDGLRILLRKTWDVSFDIKAIKENQLLGFFENYHLYVGDNTKLKLKNIPNEVENVSVFGSTFINQGEIYVNLYGNFKNISIENFIYKQLLLNTEGPQLEKQKSYLNNKIPVFVYKVSGDSSKNKIYATKAHDELIIVSNRRIKDKYRDMSKHNLNRSFKKLLRSSGKNSKKRKVQNQGLLVSLQINIESVRKKLAKDSYLLQSQVFNNTKNIVFKVVKGESRVYFAGALDTKNEETAVQIKKVLVGIVENSIQDNEKLDGIKSTLINNLQTTIDETRVILNTNIPLINKDKFL